LCLGGRFLRPPSHYHVLPGKVYARQRIVIFKFCLGPVAIRSESSLVIKFFIIDKSVVMPRERAADGKRASMRDRAKLAKSELSDHRPWLSRGHAAGITTIGVGGSLKVAAA
jgi:hypothetical protein